MRAAGTSGRTTALVLLAVFASAGAGCEGVTPENLDRWQSTVKGPEKLAAALRNADVKPTLRAHAARNLITIDRFAEVRAAFEEMPEAERHRVAAELAPGLWEDARLAGELDQPTEIQRGAKDALFELRAFADRETRDRIEDHLIEWLAGGYYEGRAGSGRVSGRTIIAAIGPKAGPRLLDRVRRVLARPPDADGRRVQIGDELLLALALCRDPEAVRFAIDLAGSERRDETLPRRALGALHRAYVEPAGWDPADPAALKPQVPALAALARSRGLEGAAVNYAHDLIAAAGPPECLAPFVEMASDPDPLRWIGTQKGVRCAGVDAIIPLAEALPPHASYERGVLERYFWSEAEAIGARDAVAERARALLEAESWVARATGIELLTRVSVPARAAADAKKIRELAGDTTVLRGWLGESSQGGKGRLGNLTLGQLAGQAAKHLEEVARGGGPG